jgi:hypothetical protein
MCLGQYNSQAFLLFLKKLKTLVQNTDTKEKGQKEDEWCQRRADYIKYLWASYQKGTLLSNIAKSDANKIWTHAYKSLKKEFADFRDKYEKIKSKLAVENVTGKQELVNELANRLKNKDQSLNSSDTKNMVQVLRTIKYKQSKDKQVSQLKSLAIENVVNCKHKHVSADDQLTPVYIQASCSSFGTLPDKDASDSKYDKFKHLLPTATVTKHTT